MMILLLYIQIKKQENREKSFHCVSYFHFLGSALAFGLRADQELGMKMNAMAFAQYIYIQFDFFFIPAICIIPLHCSCSP